MGYYALGMLDSQDVQFELGVDASRGETLIHGGTEPNVLGRASIGW